MNVLTTPECLRGHIAGENPAKWYRKMAILLLFVLDVVFHSWLSTASLFNFRCVSELPFFLIIERLMVSCLLLQTLY